MRENKFHHLSDYGKRNYARALRQLMACGAILGLMACASDDEPRDLTEPLQGFIGGIIADEPQAALIGQDILSIGGTAVDAVVASYFAMAVTLPSQASLGGGGLCVVADNQTGEVRALDFLARPPVAASQAEAMSGVDRPTAVPGNIRGLYALQARYGRLKWPQLIAPAERLARFGAQVSRAFANDLKTLGPALIVEPSIRRVFASADGTRLVGEGDIIVQYDLAAILSRLRSEGPGLFYAGPNAREFVNATTAAGGTLTLADLSGYRPIWRDTVTLPMDDEVAHFAPPPLYGGTLTATMLAMLAEDGRFEEADAKARYHLLLDTAARAFSIQAQSEPAGEGGAADGADIAEDPAEHAALAADFRADRRDQRLFSGLPLRKPENPAGATIVAYDRDGSAAACVFTLNSLFGTGRIADGTGVVLASLPGSGGRGASSFGPMLVVNENVNRAMFAAAASGGVAASTSEAAVAAFALLAEKPLSDAVGLPRVHGGSEPSRVYAEQTLDPAILRFLRGLGYPVALTAKLGEVNAIWCPGGPNEPNRCTAVSDPRGSGLALLGN